MMDLLCGLWCLSAELSKRELSEQSDGTLLQVAGQAGPDGWKDDGGFRQWRTAHGGPSRKRGCQEGRGHPSPRAEDKGPADSQQDGSGKRPCRRRSSMRWAI